MATPVSLTRTGSGLPLSRALSLQPGRGDAVDEVAAILAMIFVPVDVPILQPYRLPVTLLVLALVAWRWRSVTPTLRAGAYAFALPAYCALSAVWADAMGPAFKHGILLALTMSIAGFMAARLDRRQFVVALLVSQGALAVASLLFGVNSWSGGLDGGWAYVGIFPQKNVAGQRMMLLTLAALAVLLAPGYRLRWRLAAAAVLPLALSLLIRSTSATAIVLLAVAGSALLFAAFIWRPATLVRGLRPAVAFGGVAALALGALILANVLRIDSPDALLAALGKDGTLTGRTDIWAVGWHVLREHPLLGVGAGNFWFGDMWDAARLREQFHVAPGGYFNFHNAYFEAAVHLGLAGFLLAIAVWGRGLWMIVWSWWTAKEWGDPFWLALALALFVRSFTESELFQPTLPGAILCWVGVFAAEREARAARLATAAQRAGPAPALRAAAA